jgi:hypothetical protein
MARYQMLVGKFYFKGRRYVKGDIFEAEPSQVKGIKNQIMPLDKVEDYQDLQEDDVPRTKLKAMHIGYGKWNVMNTETDEPVNDHPLTKMEALQIVEQNGVELDEQAKKDDAETLDKKKAIEKEKKEQEKQVRMTAKLEAEREQVRKEKEEKEEVEEEEAAEAKEDEEDADETPTEKKARDTKTVAGKRRIPIRRGTKSKED